MNKLYKNLKKYHKWLGIALAFFFMFFALSGIVLNHRNWFSSVDVGRNWLPKGYHYINWNNASVRGSTTIGQDSALLYGNIGVWLALNNYTEFIDFNQGFPKGIDNRKVADLVITPSGELFAATLFGLYKHNGMGWEKVQLPSTDQRMVALSQRGDSLIVMNRSELFLGEGQERYQHFKPIPFRAPEGHEVSVSLFKTIWVIHSGEILGNFGKVVVDLGGIAILLLSITGVIYFFAPRVLKRTRSWVRTRKGIKRANRWSYQWHLKIGAAAAILLLVVTLTGMFLRPPLLIPIANKEITPIKGTRLDNPNFWNDRLRDILYDPRIGGFVLSTSEGMYAIDKNFEYAPHRFELQPPISVMGINAFGMDTLGGYFVGSFSGLFHWDPFARKLTNYLTGMPVGVVRVLSSPFGSLPIAGQIRFADGSLEFFDYNSGALGWSETNRLPPIPQEILESSGISLWNLALEVHTWRILQFVIGDFYILIVPLAGLLGAAIVISGSTMWLIRRKRKKERVSITVHPETNEQAKSTG